MLLRDWLARTGIKRNAFADRIGVMPSYITALCDGTNWPGRDVVGRIALETNGEVTANDFMIPATETATTSESGEAA